ncbi:MAG TPA: AAA family ATPase [Candidatus Krumholzibacteria bacterium]|nr:AAA family ATPase [Candidatus Krumholzibacteria bacterium]
MFTVALIGPDGVGKTTIARRLEREFPRPLKYLYMGDNVETSNVMLPTTRWWKQRQLRRQRARSTTKMPTVSVATPPAAKPASKKGLLALPAHCTRRLLHPLRKSLGLANRICEQSYREMVALWYARRGIIVLFDRHFVLDYYHFDIDPQAASRSFKRRLHGFLLRHLSRTPDLVVCLDAPGDVVFRRKGEFSPEFLEKRRLQYREFAHLVEHFELVDANRDLELVVHDVGRVIAGFQAHGQHGGGRNAHAQA